MKPPPSPHPDARPPVPVGARHAPPVARKPAPATRWKLWLAVLLAVIVVAVGGLAVWILTSGLVGGGCGEAPKPTIAFSSAIRLAGNGGDDWQFRVTAVDQTHPFGKYIVSVYREAIRVLAPNPLAAGEPLVGTATTLHLNVTDADGDGAFTEGDVFLLGNAVPGATYHVVLFWEYVGNEVSRKAVVATPSPSIAWGSAATRSTCSGFWVFGVASVDEWQALENYQVSVVRERSWENGTVTTTTVLERTNLTARFPTHDRAWRVSLNFSDADHDRLLSPGDTFTIQSSEHSETYHVLIWWVPSGEEIARKTVVI